QWLPALILGGIAGRLVDVVDHRWVMAVSTAAAAIGVGVMPLVEAVKPEARFRFLLVAGLVYASGDMVLGVASAASVPRLVRGVTVSEAISVQASVRATARVAGL